MSQVVSRARWSEWSLVKLCDGCGRKIVRLKTPAFGSRTDKNWWKIVYEKQWTGSPYYLPHQDRPHLKRCSSRYLRKRDEEAKKGKDPFFELE